MYAPHRTDLFEHLLEQITAWMLRVDAPVILAGDINTVLDTSLDQGIRVHTTGLHEEVPSDYFSDSWPEKNVIMTEERRQLWQDWTHENGLRDLDVGGSHTAYFRVSFALRAVDAHVIPVDRHAALVYQRLNQVATQRIDGIFMNNKARELLTNEVSDNDFSIDPELSST